MATEDATCAVAHGAAPASVETRTLVAVFACPTLRTREFNVHDR